MECEDWDELGDYRRSLRARRQSWFGVKRWVKVLLAHPAAHGVLRLLARRARGRVGIERLPAPRSLREVTGVTRGGTFVLLHPDRCEIAKELYWGHGRRPRPEDALALDVVVALASDADVLLDVGAYTGVFTLAATSANQRLHAHAFDIVPAVLQTLSENLRRNGVAHRVQIHRHGLGDPSFTMRVPSGEGGSALPSFFSARMTFHDGEMVKFHALDELSDLLDGDSRVVMKVDVEGAENEVFRHGRTFLLSRRPDVLCEVLHGVADGAELTDLLSDVGYRYYLVNADGLVPHQRIAPDPRFRDWLITTKGPQDLQARGVPVIAEQS